MPSHCKSQLPSALGYRLPAEWEPHASTWLAWPHFRGDWPGKFEPIPWVYAEIIRNLARHERVDLIVNSERAEKNASQFLEKANALSDNVVFHRWRTDRVWMRDSGCIFLTAQEPTPASSDKVRASSHEFESLDRSKLIASSSRLISLHFQFNAWAKYDNYKLDAKVGARMAKAAGAHVVQPKFGYKTE